jgi:hypothetical protein
MVFTSLLLDREVFDAGTYGGGASLSGLRHVQQTPKLRTQLRQVGERLLDTLQLHMNEV